MRGIEAIAIESLRRIVRDFRVQDVSAPGDRAARATRQT